MVALGYACPGANALVVGLVFLLACLLSPHHHNHGIDLLLCEPVLFLLADRFVWAGFVSIHGSWGMHMVEVEAVKVEWGGMPSTPRCIRERVPVEKVEYNS